MYAGQIQHEIMGGAKRCGLKVKWWQNLRETEKYSISKTTSLGPQTKRSTA